MLKIPSLSAPLVKDIRTGEGILEWATAVLIAISGVSGSLSIAHTAVYLTIVAAIKAARRGLLKIVAIQKGVGLGEPVPFTPTLELPGATVPQTPDTITAEIAQAEATIHAVQASPGTPVGQVTAGLAPSDKVDTPAPAPAAASSSKTTATKKS